MNAVGIHIVIEPDEQPKENVTASGIMLASTKKEKPNSGIITSIGYEVQSKELKVGSRCYYNPHAIQRIKVDDKEWIVANYEDVLCTS